MAGVLPNIYGAKCVAHAKLRRRLPCRGPVFCTWGRRLGRVAALRRFDERRRPPDGHEQQRDTGMEVGENAKASKRGRTA